MTTINTRNQSGFTLIELVMVIVILGILSAFALPRFAGLQVEARQAVLAGALGSMRSAAHIVHAKALAVGATSNCNSSSSVNLEGANINLCYLYPAASQNNGITVAAQVDSADFVITPSGNSIVVSMIGATNPAACQITYTQSAQPNNAPTFNMVDTDC